MSAAMCTIDGCARPQKYLRLGWCGTHYERWRRHGSLDDPHASVEDRFWSKVIITGFCWEWAGARRSSGHGHMYIDGRYLAAHRIAYELLIGPIPDGQVLDHLCRIRHCVNPDHLDPVTDQENIRRGYSLSAQRRRQAKCIRGHELSIGSNDRRFCPICRRAQRQARTAERVA